jgi:hypothetical protein
VASDTADKQEKEVIKLGTTGWIVLFNSWQHANCNWKPSEMNVHVCLLLLVTPARLCGVVRRVRFLVYTRKTFKTSEVDDILVGCDAIQTHM